MKFGRACHRRHSLFNLNVCVQDLLEKKWRATANLFYFVCVTKAKWKRWISDTYCCLFWGDLSFLLLRIKLISNFILIYLVVNIFAFVSRGFSNLCSEFRLKNADNSVFFLLVWSIFGNRVPAQRKYEKKKKKYDFDNNLKSVS